MKAYALTRETLELLWSDPANWKLGFIYCCKDDSRVIVPKRQKWQGWTINFAHHYSIPALILILLFVSLPLSLLAAHGLIGTWIRWIVLIVTVATVCFACWYWASPDRCTNL
jgi:hypothetical protein